MNQELIPQAVVQLLWQRFALKIAQTSMKEQRASINILSMMAGAERDIIKSNLSVLIEHGFTSSKPSNFLLARDTCSAILKINGKLKIGEKSSAEPFRLPTEHNLFVRLVNSQSENIAYAS